MIALEFLFLGTRKQTTKVAMVAPTAGRPIARPAAWPVESPGCSLTAGKAVRVIVAGLGETRTGSLACMDGVSRVRVSENQAALECVSLDDGAKDAEIEGLTKPSL